MKRITIGLKIDPDLWKEVKHRCIDKDLEYSDFVENTLREVLKKKKGAQ
ncbi:MAG TPA: hypothetical protein VHA12_04060 [Candidatus Nanoarchaeia archaeon]|nr:hypothetical protein [Candidatus Nanoarchaeia archaeon]